MQTNRLMTQLTSPIVPAARAVPALRTADSAAGVAPPPPDSRPPRWVPLGIIARPNGKAAGGGCREPCVYVYELPARMNVLALKAEPHYPFYEHGPADYRAFKAMYSSLQARAVMCTSLYATRSTQHRRLTMLVRRCKGGAGQDLSTSGSPYRAKYEVQSTKYRI